jgi:hypothetical protein
MPRRWCDNLSNTTQRFPQRCAVVTATLHQKYRYKGRLVDYRVRFTDTWVKAGDSWRYVAAHASLLQGN